MGRLPASLTIALWVVGSIWAVGLVAYVLDFPREVVWASLGVGIITAVVEWHVIHRGKNRPVLNSN